MADKNSKLCAIILINTVAVLQYKLLVIGLLIDFLAIPFIETSPRVASVTVLHLKCRLLIAVIDQELLNL